MSGQPLDLAKAKKKRPPRNAIMKEIAHQREVNQAKQKELDKLYEELKKSEAWEQLQREVIAKQDEK